VPILEIERIKGTFEYAEIIAKQLELNHVIDRVNQFNAKSRFPIKLDVLVAELRVLFETIDSEICFKYFYHCPQAKALVLLQFGAIGGPSIRNSIQQKKRPAPLSTAGHWVIIPRAFSISCAWLNMD
jgi:hypothetical protein